MSKDVVFVDGIHYALKVVDTDAEGNELTGADLDRPLTWDTNTNDFIPRAETHAPHNEQFGTRHLVEIIPGSEDE